VGYTELDGEYQRLRIELNAAYAGPVWNSRKIDRIAERIVHIEYALAAAQHAGARPRYAALATASLARKTA
jgi:hypothetical protein